MTHSVINIKCNDCNEKINGVLYDVFDLKKEYFIECQHCSKHTFFHGVAGIVDSEIPTDAVVIKYVAKL